MTTEVTAGPFARPSGWPYEPAELKTYTDLNLEQERAYFTARIALGMADALDIEAARNVRTEMEDRKL